MFRCGEKNRSILRSITWQRWIVLEPKSCRHQSARRPTLGDRLCCFETAQAEASGPKGAWHRCPIDEGPAVEAMREISNCSNCQWRHDLVSRGGRLKPLVCWAIGGMPDLFRSSLVLFRSAEGL